MCDFLDVLKPSTSQLSISSSVSNNSNPDTQGLNSSSIEDDDVRVRLLRYFWYCAGWRTQAPSRPSMLPGCPQVKLQTGRLGSKQGRRGPVVNCMPLWSSHMCNIWLVVFQEPGSPIKENDPYTHIGVTWLTNIWDKHYVNILQLSWDLHISLLCKTVFARDFLSLVLRSRFFLVIH